VSACCDPARARASAHCALTDAGAASVCACVCVCMCAWVADKQKPGVWVCKDPWVQKYSLATELPSNLQPAGVPASECAPPPAPMAAV
jgi:hypothetical protein